jgi:hypothetical protein
MGATTFSLRTLSIIDQIATLSFVFLQMLSVILLSVVMLAAGMLGVIMLSAFMSIVAAPLDVTN